MINVLQTFYHKRSWRKGGGHCPTHDLTQLEILDCNATIFQENIYTGSLTANSTFVDSRALRGSFQVVFGKCYGLTPVHNFLWGK